MRIGALEGQGAGGEIGVGAGDIARQDGVRIRVLIFQEGFVIALLDAEDADDPVELAAGLGGQVEFLGRRMAGAIIVGRDVVHAVDRNRRGEA